MRKALEEAGETIAEYLQDRKSNADRVLHQIISEVDNKLPARHGGQPARRERL